MADLGLGVLSGTRAAYVQAVRAWPKSAERNLADRGAGWNGFSGVARATTGGRAEPVYLAFLRRQTEPTVPASLLHVRLERPPELRHAEFARIGCGG